MKIYITYVSIVDSVIEPITISFAINENISIANVVSMNF